MNIEIGKTALVTVDNWFIAPDGKQYKAAFGTVRGCFTAEETLGVKTNAKSTNWYLSIGNLIITGCQIHYAIRTDECHLGSSMDWQADPANGAREFLAPSKIFNADKEYQLDKQL